MSKILFLANHFICLHAYRKELIRQLCEEGHEVYLSLPESEENTFFTDMGCKILITEMDRRGMSIKNDWKLIKRYKEILAQVQPDVVFSYTIKPNIYGCLAGKGRYRQVCNVTGTGGTFLKKGLANTAATFLYRRAFKKCHKVFFQNADDKDYFVARRMVKDNWEVLPGSGCNLEEHPLLPMPSEERIRFIFVGRVMELKGIEEYLACAKAIKQKYPDTEFLIAGFYEEEKYETLVKEYEGAGYVQYLGFRKDVADWIGKCHCTILPSHGGEGIPNVMLETAATGRVCIGSRANGTKDVIEDGKTGYLFEAGNAEDLIAKVERFILLPFAEKEAMGLAGRRKIEAEYDRKIVIEKYLQELAEATQK